MKEIEPCKLINCVYIGIFLKQFRICFILVTDIISEKIRKKSEFLLKIFEKGCDFLIRIHFGGYFYRNRNSLVG